MIHVKIGLAMCYHWVQAFILPLAYGENLNQLDGSGSPNDAPRRCSSRLFIIDLPCVDVLTTITNLLNWKAHLCTSHLLHTDVIHRLQTPAKALAPFRTSMLTHILSELLGGNALVV